MGKKKKKKLALEEQIPIDENLTFNDVIPKKENNENNDAVSDDLYAPFGDKTFNKDELLSEDLYVPFGDKTFNKDGDTSLNNETPINIENKINVDNNTGIENKINVDNNEDDINLEKIKNDNEYLTHLDENIIKENLKQKKTYDEQNQFDFELIKNYMGSSYKLFLSKKFNTYVGIFGCFYLLYRKIYLFGIALFIIMTALLTLYRSNLIILLIVIVGIIMTNIIMGFKFNNLYIKKSYNKIKNIQTKYSANRDEFVSSKCAEIGGTSLNSVILIPIILGAILIFSILQIQ